MTERMFAKLHNSYLPNVHIQFTSFQAFVGQKYGLVSLPVEIPCTHMAKLKAALEESGNDVTLIETWYQKDLNITPNVYRLRHVASSMGE